jgi:hypothetical protein
LITRADFLAATALAAASPTAPTAASTASPTPQPEPSFPPLHFDVAAFDAALATTASHRHLFATTKLAGGLVLGQMRGIADAYSSIAVSSQDVRPVAVFYHGLSITLAFDDTVWNDYFIPTLPKGMRKVDDLQKDFSTVYDAKVRGNPCLHTTGKKDDSSIETLVADYQARFFVCNEAAKGFSEFIARRLKLDPLMVYQNLASHLVPKTMLTPSGVWAVHAVQERHYTYLQATL